MLRKWRRGVIGRLADRRPGAVRIAAGGAAGGLRLPVYIDGVGIGAAAPAGLLISRAGDNGAVAAGIGVAPRYRGAGLPAVERFDLCGVSALLVLIIESRADTVADQTTQHAADRRACKPVSCTATRNRSAEKRTRAGAKQSPGVLFRAWAYPIRTPGAGRKRKSKNSNGDESCSSHIGPRHPTREQI